MDQSATPDRYRIARWKAEFEDPAVEADFREYITPSAARELRLAVIVWALLLLVFGFSDYALMGTGPELRQALAMRFTTVGMLFGLVILLVYHPWHAADGRALTVVEIVAMTLFLGLYSLTPADERVWLLAVTMVMLIGVFVFLPNRVMLATLAAAFGVIGSVTALHMVAGLSLLEFVAVFIVLLFPALLGLIVAYRFQMVRRREFAALTRIETINVGLQREVERRRDLENELKRQAATDPLTGLHNRRHYETLFEHEFRQARRRKGHLSLCIMDLDRFKRINDTFGHTAGDKALRVVADLCRAELREVDILGRLGGEEFVIMLPDTSGADALRILDRVRRRLEETDIPANGATFRLTATFGISRLLPEDSSVADLLRRADQALYEGKRNGRNQCCIA